MEPSTRDRISVDLAGLGPALAAAAKARRQSVSALVRSALQRELGAAAPPQHLTPDGPVVKLSLRLPAADLAALDQAARHAGLSRAGTLATLLARKTTGAPALPPVAELLAALTTSTAELARFNRDLHHLCGLLQQGALRAAQEYQPMLATLGQDVRLHLKLAATTLAALRPLCRAKPSGAHHAHRT